MAQLTYTDDNQFVNDAARLYIEARLGRVEINKLYSSERNFVHDRMYRAYRLSVFTDEEYLAADPDELVLMTEKANKLFERAEGLALFKLNAAATILGVEL